MDKSGLEKLAYLNLLLETDGIGPQKLFSIHARFGDFNSFAASSFSSLMNINGISRNLAERLQYSKEAFNSHLRQTEIEIEKLNSIGAHALSLWDSDYPAILKQIYYPPVVIYKIGNYELKDRTAIAVVGTRKPTNYGKLMAEKFSAGLAENNITIVSGLARGIDSIAHTRSLNSGGRTIAVIGSGLDVIYPPENKNLFERIGENGAVISEYKPGTKPDAQNFPRRNRIISGLSLGTLVIETRLNGGAMQTAQYALDQDREVFAVPGNINSPQSEGPNILIQRSSAKLVNNCNDILEELRLNIEPATRKKLGLSDLSLSLFEEKIYSLLSEEQSHIDEISIKTGLSIGDCLSNLLSLEFKGLIRQFPGKMFTKI